MNSVSPTPPYVRQLSHNMHALALQAFDVDWYEEPRRFAMEFDHNPAHLTGDANAVLPTNTVSGLWLQAHVLEQIVHHPDYQGLQCANGIKTKWKAPVRHGDHVRLVGSYVDKSTRSASTNLVRRETTVIGYVESVPVFEITISQILRHT